MDVAGKAFAIIDPLLEPLVSPATADEGDRFLSDLISMHAQPLIDRIIRYKLHFARENSDGEDLRQEAITQLLAELRRFRERPEAHPISDLRGLAAVIAHRTCSGWMRRQFPLRYALKNRLYYVLTHNKQLALWQDPKNNWIAGLAAWKPQKNAIVDGRIDLADHTLTEPVRRLLGGGRLEEVANALIAVFKNIDRPVEFDQLVSGLFALSPREAPVENVEQRAAVTDVDPAWRAEKRIFLQRLWEEVQRLPRHQRVALLLNLRDSETTDCIMLFPSSGIASVRQLADALEIPPETFARLWNELPLEDARIAEILQLTRQQVINARKSARERLTRQLKGFI